MIHRRNARIEQHDDEITRLNDIIAERDDEIDRLKADIAQRDDEIKSLSSEEEEALEHLISVEIRIDVVDVRYVLACLLNVFNSLPS